MLAIRRDVYIHSHFTLRLSLCRSSAKYQGSPRPPRELGRFFKQLCSAPRGDRQDSETPPCVLNLLRLGLSHATREGPKLFFPYQFQGSLHDTGPWVPGSNICIDEPIRSCLSFTNPIPFLLKVAFGRALSVCKSQTNPQHGRPSYREINTCPPRQLSNGKVLAFSMQKSWLFSILWKHVFLFCLDLHNNKYLCTILLII